MTRMRNSSIHPKGVWAIKVQKIQFIIKTKHGAAGFFPEEQLWGRLEHPGMVWSSSCFSPPGGKLRAGDWPWEYSPSQGKFLFLSFPWCCTAHPSCPSKTSDSKEVMRAEKVTPKKCCKWKNKGINPGNSWAVEQSNQTSVRWKLNLPAGLIANGLF